jgi:hypothetical protein
MYTFDLFSICTVWTSDTDLYPKLDPYSVVSLDPDPGRQKIITQKRWKENKFHVLKYWMFSLEGWRIFLQLGSLLCRPKNNYIAIRSTKFDFLSTGIFCTIFGHQKPWSGSGFIKMPVPDPFLMYPKLCPRTYLQLLFVDTYKINYWLPYFCVFLVPVWFVYSKMHFWFPLSSDMVLKLLIVV